MSGQASLSEFQNTVKVNLLHTIPCYRSSRPMLFREIAQNSQENTRARISFLMKLRESGTGAFLRILQNFKNISFIEHLQWLLLLLTLRNYTQQCLRILPNIIWDKIFSLK